MICPKCGTENPDYFVYCKRCSELLPSDEPTPQQRAATKVDAFSGFDPYTGVSIEKLLNEPYYDPRERHNAIDPWELLEEDKEPVGRDRFSERLDEILPPEREYRRRSRRVPLDPDSIVVTHTPRRAMRPVVKGRTAAIGKESAPQKTETDENRVVAYASAGKEALSYSEEGRSPSPYAEVVPSSPLNAIQYDEDPAFESAASPLSPRNSGGLRSEGETPSAAGSLRRPSGAIAAQQGAEAVLDDIFDEDDAPYEEKRPRKEKKRRASKAKPARKDERALVDEDDQPAKSRSGMVFWIVIAVLTAALLFASFKIVVQNYGSIGAAFSAWFGGGEQPPESNGENSVVIEAASHSGMDAHTITVYGTDGHAVVFVDPISGAELKQAVLQNGGYKLTVVDLNWIPEEAGDLTTFDVTPIIYLLDPEGNRTDLEVPSFTVNVPKTEIAVTSPDVSAPVVVESTASTLTITGTVEPGTPTRIFWEDEEYTAAIDSETGAFTIEVPLTAEKADYTLKATLARHGDVAIPITLETVISELEVTIDELPSSVTENTVAISGKTEAGAKVTVEGSGAGEVTVNADGTFSFTADLTNAGYGLKDFTVTAEIGGRTGTAAFTLLRAPEIDAYSRKAQVFEYRTVLRNPNDSKGKIYRLDATVKSSEKISDYHQVVLVHVDGDSDKPVALDYFSNSELTAGKSYRFFADANGNTEETDTAPKMPRMNAWFAGRSG
ncbi:MAG: hypothetical protein ACOYIR_01790 [Christensenellales bacterium]|jgi:hypothetical protein